ncbi:Ohr family peroxiredoxin [Blastococcus sp. SYSU D01042]
MTSTDPAQADVLHTARVAVTGGRGGSAKSETGTLQVELARPAERGTEDAGTDPEELFAAGFAACFDSALGVAARRERIRVGTTSTTASVSLTATPAGRYALTVALDVQAPDCPQADLERAVAVAETLCPYANAVRGNVPLTLQATGRQ